MTVWDEDNLGDVSKNVSWGLFAAASMTFGFRIYSRLRYSAGQGGGLFMDDFITLACLLVLLLWCILVSVATNYGVGQHYNTLSAAHQVDALKWNVVLAAITPWICSLPKFAILTTLQRILNIGPRTAALFWALALVSLALVVSMMTVGLAQCRPLAYTWDRTIAGGTCMDPNVYGYLSWVTFGYSTALDVFFALWPVPIVMRLQMPLMPRLGVAFALSLSWVGFAISCYKFAILGQVGELSAADPSYALVYLCMTHAAEGSFLIISTSLATLRPLFRTLKKQITTRTGSSAYGTGSSHIRQRPSYSARSNVWTRHGHKSSVDARGGRSVTLDTDTIVLVEAQRNPSTDADCELGNLTTCSKA